LSEEILQAAFKPASQRRQMVSAIDSRCLFRMDMETGRSKSVGSAR